MSPDAVKVDADKVVTFHYSLRDSAEELIESDPDAVRAGELWRLVTALFVQPDGVPQCVLNGFLLLAFMPAAERLYGRGILLVYFASGLAGQIVNHLWAAPGSGGSSTAAFGVIGSLLIYILRNRKELLLPFAFIASVALLGAVVMLVFRDGHGVGLLVGASVASILPLRDVVFRSLETKNFADGAAAHLGRTS